MANRRQSKKEIEQAISVVKNQVMTRNKLMAKVVETLEAEGVRFSRISFGNSYYIFDLGEDSVCHFKIEGARRWLFGIWAVEDEDPETKAKVYRISLFGEHEDYIDKFKPTQTALSRTFTLNDMSEMGNQTDIWYFVDELRAIQAHPWLEKYFRYSNRTVSVVKFLLGDFWFYRIKNPVSKSMEGKGTFLWLQLVAAAYRLRFRFSKASFDAFVYDRGKGWIPRYELRAVYGKNDEDTVRDIYMKLEKRYDDEDGLPRVKHWLMPKWAERNTRFINADDRDDRRGFEFVDVDYDGQ